MAATFGGIALVVLTIVALARINPTLLGAVALIVSGGLLLFRGAALSSQLARVLVSAGVEAGSSGGSVSMFAGLGAIVLGILAAIGLAPDTLVAIGVIVVGAAFITSASMANRLTVMRVNASDADERTKRAAEDMLANGVNAQRLAGIAAAVLGILALVHLAPGVLALVALLSLGVAQLMSTSALGGRMTGMLLR